MSDELIKRMTDAAGLLCGREPGIAALLREAADAISRHAPAPVQVPEGMVLVSERIARLAISNLDPEDCRGAAEAVSGLSAAIHGDSIRALAAAPVAVAQPCACSDLGADMRARVGCCDRAVAQVPEGWKLEARTKLRVIQEAITCKHRDERLANMDAAGMLDDVIALLAAAPAAPVAVAQEHVSALPRSHNCDFHRDLHGNCMVCGMASAVAVAQEPRLSRPAMVGNTRFGVGVKERLVIERAQREHEYREGKVAPASPSVDAEKVMALVERHGMAKWDYGASREPECAELADSLHAQIRALLTPAAGQGWIPVGERLPEPEKIVAVLYPEKRAKGGFSHGYSCYSDDPESAKLTAEQFKSRHPYWHELPELPAIANQEAQDGR